MAFSERYFLTYCDKFGNNFRTSVLWEDFEGSATELTGQPNPVNITYENSDEFKFQPIIPSTLEMGFVFDSEGDVQFEEFWTIDEKTAKVEHYKNTVLQWSGFVVPNGFEYDFIGGKYYANITAVDGLATLEGILFRDPNTNEPYGLTDLTYNDGFSFPFILIATEILRKLDLDIDLWTVVDVYERNMDDRTSDSRNSDPLAVSYVNVKTYINDTEREDIPYWENVNEVWNCQKVLENMLYIWGCKLYQQEGVWRIKRVTIDSKYGFDFPQLNGSTYWYKATYNDDGGDVFDQNYDLYSADDDLIVGSVVTNAEGGGAAIEGYYKLFTVNKIVHVDSSGEVDEVIAFTHPTYYWHKYNTLAGYIGREEINETIVIPCGDKDQLLLGNDHIMRMDEVYKQFRVNYNYEFIRDGDSPINLLKNGSFSEPYDQYGELEAPPFWERWRDGNKWFPRLRVETLTGSDITNSGGNTNALLMGQQYNDNNTPKTDPNPAIWAALIQKDISLDATVKSLYINFRVKFRRQFKVFGNLIQYFPVFKCYFKTLDKKYYALVNDFTGTKLVWTQLEDVDGTGVIADFLGFEIFSFDQPHFIGRTPLGSPSSLPSPDSYSWYNYKFDVDPPPAPGVATFFIHGLAATVGEKTSNYPPFLVKWPSDGASTIDKKLAVPRSWLDEGGFLPRPLFTGIEFAYIPDPNEEVPASDYIYANGNINFTDQREPIEVFNGDTESVEIVSSIYVPDNDTGGKNFWDTANNDFGLSDIGMIQCKAIMSQYNKPYRLLEGDLKSDNIHYGTRFEFEVLPNIQFILLRGTFNPIKGYLEGATFAQISSAAISKGGLENGQTLDPIWIDTGNTRCVKNGSGENNGNYEYEQIDSNYNSETFGDLRWVSGGEDLDSCPIGEPSKYFWGVDDSAYNLANFTDYTIGFDQDGIVQVDYTNPGGKYIFFLHLASLGDVNRVANNFQYNIISSFQYLADVTINGYLYRVLRQDFVTSQFTDFTQTFDFN